MQYRFKWVRRVTRSSIKCSGCQRKISISVDVYDNIGRFLYVRECTEDERTYYENGKKRLCRNCFLKLPPEERGAGVLED